VEKSKEYDEGIPFRYFPAVGMDGFDQNLATNEVAVARSVPSKYLLVFCNVTNKIRKGTDIVVAFTQKYSRIHIH